MSHGGLDGGREIRTRRAANEETGFSALSKSEHVEGAHERGLDSFDCIELIMRRRGGTSKVVYFW